MSLFRGPMGRVSYALSAALVFFAQHALAVAVFAHFGGALKLDSYFWLLPLRGLSRLGELPVWVAGVALAATLAAASLLVLLSLRRAADARLPRTLAGMAMIPLVQIGLYGVLAFSPSRPPPETDVSPEARPLDWASAALGTLAGSAVCVAAVVAGTLMSGTYGWGLFMISPLLIGLATGYITNRNGVIGWGQTGWTVMAALLLGGIWLVILALEGLICVLMASPIVIGAALLGGAVGREMAAGKEGDRKAATFGLAVLPLALGIDHVLPPRDSFQTRQTVEIAAPPTAVWRAVTDMPAIEPPPPVLFRLGIAYPLSATIEGEGVGATRRGVFTTGVAVERITAWEPGRTLAFTVVRDVPSMRELSPYEHVYAPHLTSGYFRTLETRFTLVPLAGGRTRVVEETRHTMRLDPALYWLPMARWMIGRNNARVLEHVRIVAERG